jgi:hypothetical protein
VKDFAYFLFIQTNVGKIGRQGVWIKAQLKLQNRKWCRRGKNDFCFRDVSPDQYDSSFPVHWQLQPSPQPWSSIFRKTAVMVLKLSLQMKSGHTLVPHTQITVHTLGLCLILPLSLWLYVLLSLNSQPWWTKRVWEEYVGRTMILIEELNTWREFQS